MTIPLILVLLLLLIIILLLHSIELAVLKFPPSCSLHLSCSLPLSSFLVGYSLHSASGLLFCSTVLLPLVGEVVGQLNYPTTSHRYTIYTN